MLLELLLYLTFFFFIIYFLVITQIPSKNHPIQQISVNLDPKNIVIMQQPDNINLILLSYIFILQ